MLDQRHMDGAAERFEPARQAGPPAEEGLRTIVVAPMGAVGPAVVKATITERLGAPRP